MTLTRISASILVLVLPVALLACATDEPSESPTTDREESTPPTEGDAAIEAADTTAAIEAADTTAATTSALTDRAALVALYNATGGPQWQINENWLSDEPLSAWYGVDTDRDGRVRYLDLYTNQLVGEIPAELGTLTELEHLSIVDGGATKIPAELGNLTALKRLELSGNRLSEVPAELGNLTALKWLDLSGNRLSEVPAGLGNLAALEELDLSENRLTGEIPVELGYLSNLRILALSDNRLTGEVPEELGDLSELEELWLAGNNLSGCLPDLERGWVFSPLGGRVLDGAATDAGQLLPPVSPRIGVVGRTSTTAELQISGWYADRVALYRSDDGESGTYDLVESNIVTTDFVDRGLNPDTTYYYRAQAFNDCGRSDLAKWAVGVITEVDGPVDVPPTPASIAGLKFDVPLDADDGGCTWQGSPGATFYQVFQGSRLDAEISAPQTDYRDYSPNTFLGAFNTTSYKVRACNKAGCSDFTETVTVR